MNITFATFLDGSRPLTTDSSLNTSRCGPLGLLDLLETRLGLKRRLAPEARRVLQYHQLLAKFAGQRSTFFSTSLQKDPFGVAQTLLQWRDGLVEAGWTGSLPTGSSRRLQDLAALEAEAPANLSPGMSDRLRRMLGQAGCAGIERLLVLETRESLPLLWQRLCSVRS